MKSSSLRQNVKLLVGLYGLALAAAAGCPAGSDSSTKNAGGGGAARRASESPQPSGTVTAKDENAASTSPPNDEPAIEPGGYDANHPKVDPVEANGPIFVDWPKPKLALLITGGQYGYLEPCGCSGLENQRGGLSRRHGLVKKLLADGWPLVAVDIGTQVRRFGPQAELQYAATADALRVMNYAAVGFGPPDLRLSTGEVIAAVAGPDPEKSIFISANASLLGLNPKLRIVEAGGKRIGITSAIGTKEQEEVKRNIEVELTGAPDALAEVVGQMAGCDLKVLMAQASLAETTEWAKAYPDFDVVITADGGDEPPNHARPIDGAKTQLIELGHKSQFAVVLAWYDDPAEPLRYQRVPLDARFGESAEMKTVMANYQDQLRERGWAGLGIRGKRHPRSEEAGEAAGQFAGSSACKECHPTAYGVWSKSKHAQATQTLVKLDPPRQFDAECIRCHATGWDPQQYAPYVTGYDSLQATAQLAGNGCENCHGPGAAHIAAENGKRQPDKDKYRSLMKQSKATAADRTCVNCHDGDNSPAFADNFEKYWTKIEHKGKK